MFVRVGIEQTAFFQKHILIVGIEKIQTARNLNLEQTYGIYF
jgi:hypothetical protein